MPKSPLTIIPGIGSSLADDLERLGIKAVNELVEREPQDLYDQLCELTHSHQDPCVLYTFRCAVYYARGGREPELLKWWNWKSRSENDEPASA